MVFFSFYLQKENTVKDSFDLYSGLFVRSKFAKEEVCELVHHSE